MIRTVKIKVINPVQTGVSKTTGNEWRRQDIVVSWMDERAGGALCEHLVAVGLMYENLQRFEQANLQVGDDMKVDIMFHTDTTSYGKVYTRIDVYMV